jgi:hypothetical protein
MLAVIKIGKHFYFMSGPFEETKFNLQCKCKKTEREYPTFMQDCDQRTRQLRTVVQEQNIQIKSLQQEVDYLKRLHSQKP